MRILFILLSVLFFFSCCERSNDSEYWPTEEWRSSSPENQKMNSDSLARLKELYGSKGNILVIRNGYIVAENYLPSADQKTLYHIFSCTKSVTSILMGIAIKQGLVNSEEDKLLTYFTDLKIENVDHLKQSISLKEVLTMTSGLQWKGGIDGKDVLEMSRNQYDWTQFVLDKPMSAFPGTQYNYNSGGTQLLSSVIHRESQMTAENFAKKYLFHPLGIDSTKWDVWPSKNGVTTGAWGLRMNLRDMAKFAYLFLQKGRWENKQIVEEEWVKKSTTNHLPLERNFGYGYQWWILKQYDTPAYSAIGMYGREHAYITVLPEYNMIVAITGNITSKMRDDIIKNYVLTACNEKSKLIVK